MSAITLTAAASLEPLRGVDMLDDDVLSQIFNHAGPSSFDNFLLVNKTWNRVANELFNQERLGIYHEIAFGPDKWKKYFGEFKINPEDFEQALNSLTRKMIRIIKGPSKTFPGELVKDTEILLWMPAGLTMSKLKEMANQYFKSDVLYIWEHILSTYGYKPIEKSYWVLMTNKNLEKTVGETWLSQEVAIYKIRCATKNPYDSVKAIEAATSTLMQQVAFGKKPFSKDYTRCKEPFRDHRVLVGYKGHSKLRVDSNGSNTGVGVAAVWRFP